MLGLFKKKKTPEQLVQTLLDALVELDEKQGAEEEVSTLSPPLTFWTWKVHLNFDFAD